MGPNARGRPEGRTIEFILIKNKKKYYNSTINYVFLVELLICYLMWLKKNSLPPRPLLSSSPLMTALPSLVYVLMVET